MHITALPASPTKLEAVLANAYYGFTYCLSDADNHRLIYVQIYHCNYFSDIDYTRYIAKDHLPLGYDATGGNEYRKYMLSTTPDGEEIPGSAEYSID